MIFDELVRAIMEERDREARQIALYATAVSPGVGLRRRLGRALVRLVLWLDDASLASPSETEAESPADADAAMRFTRRPKKLAALSYLPLFGDLTKQQLTLAIRSADEVSMGAGKLLVRQGGVGREFLLLLEGRARVERDGKTIAHLARGDFFGEMSLIDGQPCSASVVAETSVTLMVMDPRSFRSLLDEAPQLQRRILVDLCARLRKANVALAARS